MREAFLWSPYINHAPEVRSKYCSLAMSIRDTIHFVESKGSFAHDRADDGVPEVRDLGAQPAPCNRRG